MRLTCCVDRAGLSCPLRGRRPNSRRRTTWSATWCWPTPRAHLEHVSDNNTTTATTTLGVDPLPGFTWNMSVTTTRLQQQQHLVLTHSQGSPGTCQWRQHDYNNNNTWCWPTPRAHLEHVSDDNTTTATTTLGVDPLPGLTWNMSVTKTRLQQQQHLVLTHSQGSPGTCQWQQHDYNNNTWCWPTPRAHLEHVSDNNTTTTTTTLGVDPLPGLTWNMSVTTTRLQQQQHLVLTHSQGSPGTCQWQKHDYSNNNTWCWPTPRAHLEHVSDNNMTTATTTLGVDPLPGFTWNMSVTTTRLQQQQHLVLTHSQGSPGTCQWRQHDYNNNNTWCWPTPRAHLEHVSDDNTTTATTTLGVDPLPGLTWNMSVTKTRLQQQQHLVLTHSQGSPGTCQWQKHDYSNNNTWCWPTPRAHLEHVSDDNTTTATTTLGVDPLPGLTWNMSVTTTRLQQQQHLVLTHSQGSPGTCQWQKHDYSNNNTWCWPTPRAHLEHVSDNNMTTATTTLGVDPLPGFTWNMSVTTTWLQQQQHLVLTHSQGSPGTCQWRQHDYNNNTWCWPTPRVHLEHVGDDNTTTATTTLGVDPLPGFTWNMSVKTTRLQQQQHLVLTHSQGSPGTCQWRQHDYSNNNTWCWPTPRAHLEHVSDKNTTTATTTLGVDPLPGFTWNMSVTKTRLQQQQHLVLTHSQGSPGTCQWQKHDYSNNNTWCWPTPRAHLEHVSDNNMTTATTTLGVDPLPGFTWNMSVTTTWLQQQQHLVLTHSQGSPGTCQWRQHDYNNNNTWCWPTPRAHLEHVSDKNTTTATTTLGVDPLPGLTWNMSVKTTQLQQQQHLVLTHSQGSPGTCQWRQHNNTTTATTTLGVDPLPGFTWNMSVTTTQQHDYSNNNTWCWPTPRAHLEHVSDDNTTTATTTLGVDPLPGLTWNMSVTTTWLQQQHLVLTHSQGSPGTCQWRQHDYSNNNTWCWPTPRAHLEHVSDNNMTTTTTLGVDPLPGLTWNMSVTTTWLQQQQHLVLTHSQGSPGTCQWQQHDYNNNNTWCWPTPRVHLEHVSDDNTTTTTTLGVDPLPGFTWNMSVTTTRLQQQQHLVLTHSQGSPGTCQWRQHNYSNNNTWCWPTPRVHLEHVSDDNTTTRLQQQQHLVLTHSQGSPGTCQWRQHNNTTTATTTLGVDPLPGFTWNMSVMTTRLQQQQHLVLTHSQGSPGTCQWQQHDYNNNTWCWPTPRAHLEHVSDDNTTTATTTLGVDPLPGLTWNMSVTTTWLQQQHLVLTHSQGSPGTCQWQQHDYSNNNTWCWPTSRAHLEHVSDANTNTATTLGEPLQYYTEPVSACYGITQGWYLPAPVLHRAGINLLQYYTGLVSACYSITQGWYLPATVLHRAGICLLQYYTGLVSACYSITQGWYLPATVLHRAGICLLQYYTGLVSACYSITQGWYLPAPVFHRAGICLLQYYTGPVSACSTITQGWYLPATALYRAGICLLQYYKEPVSACYSIIQGWYLPAPLLHRAGICLLQHYTGLVSACSSITKSRYLPAPVLHRASICLLQYYTELVSAYSSITQGRYLPAPLLHRAGICLLQYYTGLVSACYSITQGWYLPAPVFHRAGICLLQYYTGPVSACSTITQGWYLPATALYRAGICLLQYYKEPVSACSSITQGWYLPATVLQRAGICLLLYYTGPVSACYSITKSWYLPATVLQRAGICLLLYYTGPVSACYSITKSWYLPATVLQRAGICLLLYYTGPVSACYSITKSWYLPATVLQRAGICLLQYYTEPVSACSSITQSWYLPTPVLHRASICLLQYYTELVSACSSITQSQYLPAPVLHRASICLLQYYTELVSAYSSITQSQYLPAPVLYRAGICLIQYYTGLVSACSSITQGCYLPAPVFHRAGICLLQYYTEPVSACSSITQSRYLPAPVLHRAGICLLQYYTELVSACSSITQSQYLPAPVLHRAGICLLQYFSNKHMGFGRNHGSHFDRTITLCTSTRCSHLWQQAWRGRAGRLLCAGPCLVWCWCPTFSQHSDFSNCERTYSLGLAAEPMSSSHLHHRWRNNPG